MESKGDFKDLAERKTSRHKPMSRFARVGARLLGAVLLVGVYVALKVFVLNHKPSGPDRAADALCGHGREALLTCFQFSKPECEQAAKQAYQDCADDFKAKPNVANVGQDVFMGICLQQRYLQNNSAHFQDSIEKCHSFRAAIENMNFEDYAAEMSARKNHATSRKIVFKSARLGYLQTQCNSDFMSKCALKLTEIQCQTYANQAADECEKSLTDNLPAEIPEAKQDTAIRQAMLCIHNLTRQGMAGRHEIKPECGRDLASQ